MDNGEEKNIDVSKITFDEYQKALDKGYGLVNHTSKTIDWGSRKGQGKRTGSTIQGSMSAMIQGKQTYRGIKLDVPDYEKVKSDFTGRNTSELYFYMTSRKAGFDHRSSMIFAIYKNPQKAYDRIKYLKSENKFNDGGLIDSGTLVLLKNTQKAPNMGKLYGQDVEPAGLYAVIKRDSYFDQFPNYKTVLFETKKPLIVTINDGNIIKWKYDLSEKYKAKGKALTKKLLKDGYDCIITQYKEGDTGEIIVLDTERIQPMKTKFKEGGITHKYSFGERVEFTVDSEDTYTGSANTKKYYAGQSGSVRNVTQKDGKPVYDINMGMTTIKDVPEDNIRSKTAETQEKVEKILDEKQVKKEFKDVGKRVGGSKKEKRAYALITFSDIDDLEKDEITAFEMVTKDRVYPEVNVLEQQAAGVSSGAAFLKVKIREACGTKPPNSSDKRKAFIRFIDVLTKGLNDLKKVNEVVGYLETVEKLSADDVINFFFDPEIYKLNEDQKIRVRAEFKRLFPWASMYSVIKKLTAEVFGKRFSNFIFFESDVSRDARQQAKLYEAVSADESEKNIAEYKLRQQKFIDANSQKIEDYKGFSAEELKKAFYDWKGMDRFRKDLEGFRKSAIEYYQRRVDEGEKLINQVPDRLLQREDDWSWFEDKKEKKTISKSGEPIINSGLPLSFIKRTGGLVIGEQYVEQSRETDLEKNPITRDFGFKSIQFGNALSDVRAREHIRHFLGAMSDMAEILDIDIKQLNGIGGLSIAFASRGTGRALAHFEAGRSIINLTNKNGDGTVAHEFGHYLDNALTIFPDKKISLEFGSSTTMAKTSHRHYSELMDTKIQNSEVADAMWKIIDFFLKGQKGITPTVHRSFQALPEGATILVNGKEVKQRSVPTYHDEIRKGYLPVEFFPTIEETLKHLSERTAMLRDINYTYPDLQAKLIGYVIAHYGLEKYDVAFYPKTSAYYYYSLQMSSKYWSSMVEMFARAWECYIFDKLQFVGRTNNYLVSGGWFSMPIVSKSGAIVYVYPFGDERKHLYGLYDNLVNVVRKEFNLEGFKPFVDKREDEYLVIDGKGEEKDGVVVEEKFEEGGIAGYDVTESILNEFDHKKQSAAAFGEQKWVNRIPKKITEDQLSFIPQEGLQEKRISGLLLYGYRDLSKDQKRFIIRALMDGQLSVIENHSGYLLIRKEKFEDGGSISNPENTYVTIWSRTSPEKGKLFNDNAWVVERTHTLPYIFTMFGHPTVEGETVWMNRREYAWFREGINPNKKRQDRLNNLVYDKIVRDMHDTKKSHYTEKSFEDWWNRTTISDNEKEYVKNKLIENELLK